MNWTIKAAGMLLLFVACTLSGFYKAHTLGRRAERLKEFSVCLAELGARIRHDGAERGRLLEAVFGGKELLILSGRKITVADCGISAADRALLNEYFSLLGSSGGEAEYNRTQLYLGLLAKQCADAQKDASELMHLYRTVGICAGVFGCILFL